MSTVEEITALIVQKGEDIRSLKASGAAKDALMPHVNELLQLKEKLVIPFLLLFPMQHYND